ncbi:YdaS family helix-turn-helix protein [Sporolactobacillus sp. CQH2019]|uniref:YdaS family helix-turn-helix protein n=1 Tax=Sporolactobacillus sp. CQH2019 TaxID=3023512 RepID=UPI0023674CF1|nr:YdaS family helix-turn-helix protein [Sporolactobacillus sp. CQH2019]MDD9149829.1 YdaS family helix-turn-helix protein [Sporolactobacillus sp. CQH2019]
MIGLEYILGLYNMQQLELAERLGIKKQNINLWIKGKQHIPKKYLPVLEKLFHVNGAYFSKELTDIEKLEIQKEKLKHELQPIIKRHEQVLGQGGEKLESVPVYDREEMNKIERAIEKEKLIQRFKATLERADKLPYMDTYRIILELLEQAGSEIILQKTIQGLAHYLNVLPGDITTGSEQEEFEAALFEVLDDYNY